MSLCVCESRNVINTTSWKILDTFSTNFQFWLGVCGWQKIISVPFLVRFCKKLRFSVQYQFYKINRGFGFFGWLGLHSTVNVNAIFHLSCLYSMTLEMTYFRAELIQLIVSQSDSALEVQRYSLKKNTLTVDPVMLQDELWMRKREKPSPNSGSRFFENRTAETEFLVFEFWGRFGF